MMKRLWARAMLIFAGLASAAAVAVRIGSSRERRATSVFEQQVVRAGAVEMRQPIGTEAPGPLPAPVARYLGLALPYAQRIRTVRLRQEGVLRTDPRGERWMTFEAEHIATSPAPGFVWSARVRVAPLLHLRVRDALVGGVGSGRVSLLSAFPVATDGGTEEMSSGSLHRYLAEAVWYPSALLPSDRLRWEAIDDHSARATLSEGGSTVSLEFRFAADGTVSGIHTLARWGRFDGAYRQLPWEGHFRAYEEVDGMIVPMEGEVGWYLDDVWQAVWKGRITSASFELVEGKR